MKKTLLITTILASTALHAEAHKGFVAGITAGYTNAKVGAYISSSSGYDSTNNPNSNGGLAGITLGYFAGENFNFGAELQFLMAIANQKASINSLNSDRTETQYRYTATLKNQINFAVRLGRKIENTVPYLKLGVSSGQFQIKLSAPGGSDQSNSPRKTGLLVGLGIDVGLNKCSAIGLDFTRCSYKGSTYTQNNSSANITYKTSRITTYAATINYKRFF